MDGARGAPLARSFELCASNSMDSITHIIKQEKVWLALREFPLEITPYLIMFVTGSDIGLNYTREIIRIKLDKKKPF